MPVPARRAVALLLLLAAALAPSGVRAASTQDIAVRAVAQEGLAIAEAASVLQIQLEVLLSSIETDVGTCEPLFTGGDGSVKVIASTAVSTSVTKATVGLYYDKACADPYLTADTTATAGTSESIVETAQYVGLNGAALGTLGLSETAGFSSGGTVVVGTGTFTPATPGAPPATLGLQCTIPAAGKVFVCTGGIAQNFPALNTSIASLTQLRLKVAKRKPFPVSFTGASAARMTGALGALSIGKTAKGKLVIKGTGTDFGATTAAGGAGCFVLFPPTPTGWTVDDAANDVRFSLSVVSDATRKLTGTVTTISTGVTLATVALDRSGTGRITYGAGGKSFAVTGWTLRD